MITASILLLIKSIFTNSLIPWYRHITYKGIKLEGSWYQYTNNQKILLELTQHCEYIKGKATVHALVQREDHYDSLKTFDVSGYISERFLLITLKHTDKRRLGLVTQLVQIDGDGTVLKGQGSWYAPRKSEIISGEIVYYRNEASAKKNYDLKLEQLKKVSTTTES